MSTAGEDAGEDNYLIKINSSSTFTPIIYSNTIVETSYPSIIKPCLLLMLGFLSFSCLVWSVIRCYYYLTNE